MSWRMLIASLFTVTVAVGTAWAVQRSPAACSTDGAAHGCPYSAGAATKACPYGSQPAGHGRKQPVRS
jgi:hypothetical protein